ncbi:MAG: NAD(P)H-hydrate dehydratase [Oligoflexales bacterium]|nr:NAD(P)H-hydrate dehydratase [Oligoflexales bacterium]
MAITFRYSDYLGELYPIRFGLSEAAHEQAKPSATLLQQDEIGRLLPKLFRQRHKYQAGLLHVWAGSKGMEGSAALVCRSALRSGCGLVKLAIDEKHHQGFSSLDLEVVSLLVGQGQRFFNQAKLKFMIEHFNKGDACVIGPGISLDMDMQACIHELVPSIKKPLVLDADGLTAYAERPFSLPKHTVMTPHIGELKRLLGIEGRFTMNRDSLQLCQDYVEEHQLTLLVKGAPTFIFHPQTEVKIMPRGNPGMATAGAGDVLAGMIGAFLAQGLGPLEATCVGAYLHGVSGELAAKDLGSFSLMATDLIANLPKAFAFVEIS